VGERDLQGCGEPLAHCDVRLVVAELDRPCHPQALEPHPPVRAGVGERWATQLLDDVRDVLVSVHLVPPQRSFAGQAVDEGAEEPGDTGPGDGVVH